jgi:hypothetical protein
MGNYLTVADLKNVEGAPRVHDLRLADRFGFGRDRDIRKLISRNTKLLEMHGELVCDKVAQTSKGGRPGKEYWLNEDQAVVLGFLSEAPDAVSFQKEVIAVWKAFRTGEFAPSIVPSDVQEIAPHMRKALGGIVKSVVDTRLEERLAPVLAKLDRIESGTMVAALAPDATVMRGYVNAFVVVDQMAKVPEEKRKRCRNICQTVSSELHKWCARNGIMTHLSYPPGEERLFPRDRVQIWLADPAVDPNGGGGYKMIWARINVNEAKKAGQGVFPFKA